MNIRVEDIHKTYGESAALHGVSLEIPSGELVALLGPSGSGKTTLLRVIAGLETPARGSVYFGDLDASRIPVRERQVGFVFQHYALFRHMTVAENIAFGLSVRPRAQRPNRAERKLRVRELLELVQLNDLEDRYPGQLSGGQQQRVALARALAVEPRVLLLDEPFGALDARVRKDLRRWLRKIHDQVGATTVFVTHDQEEAMELADRVAILNLGRVEQWGTPDEIYDHPATPFVHQFVGESNCLPVTFSSGKAWLSDQELPLDGTYDGAKYGTLYVRYQDWTVDAGRSGAIRGVVQKSTRSGTRRRVEVSLGSALNAFVDTSVHQFLSAGMNVTLTPLRWQLFLDDGSIARSPGTVRFDRELPEFRAVV